MSNQIKYDIVICVGPQHIDFAIKMLPHLIKNLQSTNIIILTQESNFKYFPKIEALKLLNENEILPDLSLSHIKSMLKSKNVSEDRAGWYFQQFLKMAISQKTQSAYYLIWDADTLPLKNIKFFNTNKQVLIHTSAEHHLPYFNTLIRILGLEKKIQQSFISEHFMIETEIMKSLIEELSKVSNKPWFEHIIDRIDKEQLANSGFSEYETYGTYLASNYPNNFQLRTPNKEVINSFRFGTRLFSNNPSLDDIELLSSLGFHYVTFEVWDTQNRIQINKNKKLSRIFKFTNKYQILSVITNHIKKRILKQIQIHK